MLEYFNLELVGLVGIVEDGKYLIVDGDVTAATTGLFVVVDFSSRVVAAAVAVVGVCVISIGCVSSAGRADMLTVAHASATNKSFQFIVENLQP